MFRNNETLHKAVIQMKKLPQAIRIILGGLALAGSAVLSWILEYFIGNISMLTIILGGIVFAILNPELMDGQ